MGPLHDEGVAAMLFVKTANVLCVSKHGIAALELFEYGLLDSSHPAGGAMEYSGIRPEWMKAISWVPWSLGCQRSGCTAKPWHQRPDCRHLQLVWWHQRPTLRHLRTLPRQWPWGLM